MTNAPGESITVKNSNGTIVTVPKSCFYGYSGGLASALIEAQIGLTFNTEDCFPNAGYTQIRCYNSWWLEPLYSGGNASFESVSTIIGRMADSITDQLRMNGTDWYGNPANVTGTAYQTVVCNQFEAQWLSFPAGIILTTAVLLAATARRSQSVENGTSSGDRVRIPVWKVSILPLLFYGLEDGARLKEVVEETELAKTASGTKAELSTEGNGLQFRKQ